jgi:hypothetical protein
MISFAASIMMIEGLGQQNYGSLNWGDGLATDPTVIANKKLSDPNLFFQQLLKKPYRRQVIVGVHVYPPSISKVQKGITQQGLTVLCVLLWMHPTGRGAC